MNLCSRCSGELPRFAVFCPHCAQAHEPNFDDLINLTIDGRYRVYRRLGQGGLSTIFAATDLETDSVVAIKISNPAQLVLRAMNYALDAARARDYWDEMLERMRREAETLATINHPNILRFDGTSMINDDLRYVVMEFLHGSTLRDEIDRNGAFEPSRAVGVALEIASALIEVHARGIVHRDINPRNIMIADCGLRIADCELQESLASETLSRESAIRIPHSAIEASAFRIPHSAIKLIDFGIAKFPQPPGAPPFTQHATLAGTVAYASPEQCASHPVDHRSDIYSLGVVFYEMVTGQRPFFGRTPTEVALKQIQSEPKPPRSINPAISAALEKTILRALAKNPIDRQQSADELSEELRTSTNQILIPLIVARPEAEDEYDQSNGIAPYVDPGEDEETAESNLKLVRRRRRRFVVASAATLMAVIAAALYSWSSAPLKRNAADVSANVVAQASPSPEDAPAVGNDPDSLELAASAPSQNNNGANVPNPGAQATPDSTRQNLATPDSTRQNQATPDSTRQNLAANSSVANNRAASQTAIPPTPSPAPVPIPPRAQPQMPPAPSPDITLKRSPQPESEPDLSQGPGKENEGGALRRENDSATDNSNWGRSGDTNRDLDRDDDYAPNRRRNDNTFNRRRLSDPPNRDEGDRNGRGDDNDDSARIGPKLYQWSGRVDYQREITIELPGVPGSVEVPRAFRDRVGVIEPPSANNRWSCVVLRVFGRGGVSIVVRFWPASRNTVKLTAWR